jgi:hypothetical protein
MKQLKVFFLKHRHQLGIVSIALGVVLLASGILFSWTLHNWFTLLCLLLIIGGAVTHVAIMKRESRY